ISSATRYLMPLFPPGLIRHSSCSSKLSYCPTVMRSPPCWLCSPLPATCLIVPCSITQPSTGTFSRRKPRQPFQLLPSKSSFQPAAFSAWLREFGERSTPERRPAFDWPCTADTSVKNTRTIARLAHIPQAALPLLALRASCF